MKANFDSVINGVINAVHPKGMFFHHLKYSDGKLFIKGKSFDIDSCGAIRLVGVGKASSQQIDELSSLLCSFGLSEKIKSAFVVTKKDHLVENCGIDQIESSHPYCDGSSMVAGEKMIEHLQTFSEDDLVLFSISGGASSLLIKPVSELSLDEFILLNKTLVTSDVTIEEINTVRKTFSDIKNGGLLKYTMAKTVVNLGVSDIPSNDFSMIGSSPTCHSPIEWEKLLEIIDHSFSESPLLEKLLEFVNSGRAKEADSKKEMAFCEKDVHNFLLADFEFLMERTSLILNENYPKANIMGISECLNAQLDEIVRLHVDLLRNNLGTPHMVYSGGEVSLKVTGDGRGGRNLHFVACMAHEIFEKNIYSIDEKNLSRIRLMSLGTDGTDGPTEYAGAWIDYETWLLGKNAGIDLEGYINSFNTMEYFEKIDTAIKTGPTGTNIMDLRVVAFF
ncbi:MAG: DUF4147 domain-containing protein [Bacteriovoracaceae bacterium]|nr:DUF4147 domain-containing protein [Bacteriovoracaceae bacterium]